MDTWIGRSAEEIAGAVRRGEVEPRLVVQQHLDRIERLNPQLNAFRRIRHEEALTEADELAVRSDLAELPLAGVPIAVKDNVWVEGEQTRRGSAASPASVNPSDHPVVARLRAAGAIVVGLTNVPELCLVGMTDSVYGIARNPWDRNRTPGGSSGGSAAAVAAAMVPIAHGNDGLGSIRIPSSCCGLFGIKPGAGVVPAADVEGDEPPWFGLSENGVLGTSVHDVALVLSVMAGAPELAEAGEGGRFEGAAGGAKPAQSDGMTEPNESGGVGDVGRVRPSDESAELDESGRAGEVGTAASSSESAESGEVAEAGGVGERAGLRGSGGLGAATRAGEPGTVRIGVSVRPLQLGVPIDKQYVAATLRTGELLAEHGHSVTRHTKFYPSWLGPGVLLNWFAAAYLDGRTLDKSRLDRSTRGFVGIGNALVAVHLNGARTRARWRNEAADAFFGDVDVLVLPSLTEPPPMAQRYGDRRAVRNVVTNVKFASLFAPWNLAGWPAMNIPAGVHDVGTPLGVQLVARPGGESLLLALAAQLEAARPWARHAPDYRL
jgi:amidase